MGSGKLLDALKRRKMCIDYGLHPASNYGEMPDYTLQVWNHYDQEKRLKKLTEDSQIGGR